MLVILCIRNDGYKWIYKGEVFEDSDSGWEKLSEAKKDLTIAFIVMRLHDIV